MLLSMSPLKFKQDSDKVKSFFESLEQRMPGENLEVQNRVRQIISQVKAGGKSALLEIREKLENVSQSVPLTYTWKDLVPLAQECPTHIQSVLSLSAKRISDYHRIQTDSSRTLEENGARFTSFMQPLDSVALYVPGGQAFYPSTLLMTAIPAEVAGVGKKVIFTPSRSLANPIFAYTAVLLKAQSIVAVGGAQAVAAAAFGIPHEFERCDKIVGPGNIYVSTAKHLLSGRIGIDSFAGPSEILVLSDGSSDPKWIAADLLSQAEHDAEASAILVTTSTKESELVLAEIKKLLPQLGNRQSIATASLNTFGAIIQVDSKEDLLDLANKLNPEHLHIHTTCALQDDGQKWWAQNLKGVGAVFFGRYTAECFGDYLAGPSHVLPTAGTARFASPLGVYDFTRRSSHLYLTESKAKELATFTEEFAKAEELWAHGISARLRHKNESL